MSKIKKNVKYADILALAKEYSEKLEEVKKKQSYHLNIIEELHINENAHSRILAKLLQYKDNEGKYVFLQSLLEYINDKNGSSCDFSKINVVSPEITQEKDRIDVLVLGEKQAVIIENKICGADDQEKQLHRYVEKVKSRGYEKGDIYIVYLTKYYQSPSSDAWISSEEKNEFSARYLNLSYMYDVLPWLEEEFEQIPLTQNELKGALEQYVNYLKTLKENKMEKELKNYFDEEFEKDLGKVSDGYNKTKKLLDDFPNYIYDLIKSKIDEWNRDKGVKPFKDKNPQKYPLVTELSKNGSSYFLYLELSDEFDTVSCCLEQKNGDITNSKLLKELSRKIELQKEHDRKYYTRELGLTNDNLNAILDDFKVIHDFFKEK